MLPSVKHVHNQSNKLTSTEQSMEWWNCRRNPFYFIFNYVCIPEIGGVMKYEETKMAPKIKQTVRATYRYHKCLLMASRQLGKALDINTPIPMADGSYKNMEFIEVDDFVLDINEKPNKVIAITEILYNRPCYKLEFDINDEIICDENHLWRVFDKNKKREEIYTTKQLYEFNDYFDIILENNRYFRINNIEKCLSVPVKCIQVENNDGMFLCGKYKIPTHNSTISAALLEWACNFYPRMPANILNANKGFGLENLEKVKYVHSQLPAFLRTPLKYRGERKTTIDYKNDSILRVFYPSSSTSPTLLARSLTSPILYVDEAAFIKGMREAYGSAQPTLSRARQQAAKNQYPYFILITTTPNGTFGDGEWFYEMWWNSISADDIFDDDNQIIEEASHLVNNPERNGFVKIKYHWSEDKTKDEAWYLEQKRDLNFDTRLINQELDLVFVGSKSCLFSDEFLGKLKSHRPVDKLKLPHGNIANLFNHRDNLDKSDYYLIGCDTAKTLTGDYSAIEIYSYSNFVQIGEYFNKLGSLKKYSDIIKAIVDVFYSLVQHRIILCIENNSMGAAVIENLENTEGDFDYTQFIYSPTPDKSIGINTNKATKPTMISFLYDFINENPENIKSEELIKQLNVIERRGNGSIGAPSKYKDDLFMASALAAYVKKISSLEIDPLLGVSTIMQQQKHINTITSAITPIGNKNVNSINIRYNKEESGIEYIINDLDDYDLDDDSPVLFL